MGIGLAVVAGGVTAAILVTRPHDRPIPSGDRYLDLGQRVMHGPHEIDEWSPAPASMARGTSGGRWVPDLRRAGVWLPLFALAAACSSASRTALRLKISFEPSLALDQLRVQVKPGDSDNRVPETPSADPLSSGMLLVLLVPDAWDGQTAEVTLTGLRSHQAVASGAVKGTVRRAQVVDLEVVLLPPCVSECTPGESRCEKEQVQLCVRDSQGCARFTPPEPCPPATPFCSGNICVAKCTDDCAAGTNRCQGSGYQTCGQYDADTCLDWSPVIGCRSDELCRATDGQCVLACDGKPCPCQPGQTQPCTNFGECSNGTRACVNGQYGPCQWQVGPKPEECDGKDNDCDGTKSRPR